MNFRQFKNLAASRHKRIESQEEYSQRRQRMMTPSNRISSMHELFKLAEQKKSVYHSIWGCKPAAVIINMNCASVYHSLDTGYFYYYIPKEKAKILPSLFLVNGKGEFLAEVPKGVSVNDVLRKLKEMQAEKELDELFGPLKKQS